MKDFRTTPYIQLLSKGAATKEEFQNALSDFAHQIYNFCSKEENIRFIYFSLNYIRAQLIHIEEIKETTGGRLSANGGITFVEAAIEWIKNKIVLIHKKTAREQKIVNHRLYGQER